MNVSKMVALDALTLNTSLPVITETYAPDQQERFAPPPGYRRTKLSTEARGEIVRRYQDGETTREVAEACSCSKTAVLTILKQEGVVVRPTGSHY